MLRKRSIALIVLLLTITVVSISVRSQNQLGTDSKPAVLTPEPEENITPPESPSTELKQSDLKETPVIKDAKPEPEPDKTVTPACYVGGCSSQLCTDSPDIASTCEWRESYACYRNATCERQTNGQCGWTQTTELKSCLNTADAVNQM